MTPFYAGSGFTVSNPGKEIIVYAEGDRGWELLAAWGDQQPVLGIPRPEVWDYVVPPWLWRRYEVVKERLIEHSGHDVVFDPDDWYADKIRGLTDDTEVVRPPCPCCDADVVAPGHESRDRVGELAFDAGSTQAAIVGRLADGRFQIIRSDASPDQVLEVPAAETRWSVATFLRCTVCDETIFWGPPLPGAPTYRHVRPAAPFTWPWASGRPRLDNAEPRPRRSHD